MSFSCLHTVLNMPILIKDNTQQHMDNICLVTVKLTALGQGEKLYQSAI